MKLHFVWPLNEAGKPWLIFVERLHFMSILYPYSLKGLELYNSMREEARGFEGVSEYKKAAKAHTEKHAKRNNYEMLKKV